MIAAVLFAMLFVADNREFFDTVEEQQKQGYKWTKVGKSEPSGTPALVMKNNNEEYIYYRLEK